jgi:hypothetical protein
MAAPGWDDPRLNELAHGLREAHERVAVLSPHVRPRLTRHLLAVTDLAKRDPELAMSRLKSLMEDLNDDQNVP